MPGPRSNPGAVAWEDPRCQVLRSAIEEVTSRAPSSYQNHYAGDIRFPIRLLDTPAFGIGSLAGNFYGPNEWVDMDDLVSMVARTDLDGVALGIDMTISRKADIESFVPPSP